MLYSQTLGNGPNLVMLHGWGMHSGLFQHITGQLSEHYCITLIDLPGYGQSPMLAGNYNLNTVVNAVADAAPQQAHWLGWSLGGLIATHMAATSPKRVLQLINVCSTPKFLASDHWPGMPEKNLQHFASLLERDYTNTLKHFINLQFYATKSDHQLLRDIQQQVLDSRPNEAALSAGLDLLKTTDLRATLSQVSCPTHFILGRLDAIVPADVGTAITELKPDCTIHMITKASHAPFISHKKDFLAILNKVMTQHDA